MYDIGVFNPRRGVGTSLIAAHLLGYLKDHGIYACAAVQRGDGMEHRELEERWGFAKKLGHRIRLADLEPPPPGPYVSIQDIRSTFPMFGLRSLLCRLSIVVIRDEESFVRGVEAVPNLPGTRLCVWNGASEQQRARCRLPASARKLARFATTTIPHCAALARAHETATLVWRLPGGSESPGGRAMARLMREILRNTTLDLDLLQKARVPHVVAAEGVAR